MTQTEALAFARHYLHRERLPNGVPAIVRRAVRARLSVAEIAQLLDAYLRHREPGT